MPHDSGPPPGELGAGEERVTRWLERWAAGDGEALDRILPAVYDELRRVAHRVRRGERSDHTLSTTAIVHETYLRLAKQRTLVARDRHEFFALVGQAMRHVLVDHARARLRAKRGGGAPKVPLDEALLVPNDEAAAEVLEIDDALARLTAANPRAAFVVQQKVFAGASLGEIARFLEVSEKTAQRDWTVAIAWLRKEVRSPLAGHGDEA